MTDLGGPPRPRSRAPNPWLLLGIVSLSTWSFFYVLEKRKDTPLGRRMHPDPLKPPVYKDDENLNLLSAPKKDKTVAGK